MLWMWTIGGPSVERSSGSVDDSVLAVETVWKMRLWRRAAPGRARGSAWSLGAARRCQYRTVVLFPALADPAGDGAAAAARPPPVPGSTAARSAARPPPVPRLDRPFRGSTARSAAPPPVPRLHRPFRGSTAPFLSFARQAVVRQRGVAGWGRSEVRTGPICTATSVYRDVFRPPSSIGPAALSSNARLAGICQ